MKILILSPRVPYPPKDGGALATLGIAAGLAQTGVDITILCLNTSKHFSGILSLPEKLNSDVKIIPVFHDTEIRYTKALYNLLFSQEPYTGTRFISSEYKTKLITLLRENEYDIIQIEGPYMGYYIPVIRKYSKTKISLRAHNVEYEIWSRKASNDPNLVTSKYLSMLSERIKNHESRILKSVDLLIPISEKDQELLLKLNPNLRSLVIPAGVDAGNYPELRNPEYPSLFFIGSLDWMPNQEGLIWFLENVWPEVQKANIVKFHIAGRNAPGWLEKRIILKDIVYHGEVEDALEFMNNYAIMISPVFSGSGIRIKIIEAMMMQRVVISTSIGAEGISYAHDKNIIIADDPSAFVKYIKEYSTNQRKFNRIAKNARNLILKDFSNMDFCNQLCEFYRNSLK